MTLTTGTQLGAFEILAPIGAGGMGEVYRARDTKLGREVAIKVLSEAFSQDKERVDRFEREARLLASLNHPGIATIHGFEEEGDQQFLVMELVEGETLADRIARGALPFDEVIPLFREIAEALEAAHESGVIHRDLKPANIKITPEGKVKLLDFGLAKAFEPDQATADSSQSPTLTKGTALGAIMGTASYMSPEQARGTRVDKRTDIWAFGCCLFEALTGRKAFDGEVVTETLAAVLKNEPDWSALPAGTPAALQQVLRLCFEKDPKRRVRDVGDVRLAMEGALETPTTPHPRLRGWRPSWAIAAALILSFITGVVVYVATRPEQTPRPVARFRLTLPSGVSLSNTGRHAVTLSPHGTHLAYIANEQLYLRDLQEIESTPVSGTVGVREPFFSPDGGWVGFWVGGMLKKVSISGGAPITLCDADNPRGASWDPGGTIVFGQEGVGIMQVSADGGEPEVIVPVHEPGEMAGYPQLLPDREAVMFTVVDVLSQGKANIVVHFLETDETKVLVEGGRDARYLPMGYLVYELNGELLAAPFDTDKLEVTGGPISMVEGVMTNSRTSAAQYAVSDTGSLIYVGGGNSSRTLVWVDRQGREEPLSAEPRAYTYPRISPDGQRVALDVRDQQNDIWLWDFKRETLTRLTFNPDPDGYPIWQSDGRRVIFGSRYGSTNLSSKAADGSGAVERLAPSGTAYSHTKDGKQIVIGVNSRQDLSLLSTDGSLEPLLETEFTERNAELSPDNKWLAYEWDGSGRFEIFVRPFPNVEGGPHQISTGGGTRPLWGPDGRELFYLSPDGQLMAVRIQTEDGFVAGNALVLLDAYYYGPRTGAPPGRTYDIHPDGERFLMIKEAEGMENSLSEVILVQNWFEELKRLVPVN